MDIKLNKITNQIIQEIKEKIITEINPESIIVFGSFAKGTFNNESDIDLLIVWNEQSGLSKVKRRIILKKLIGFTNVPVDIITYTSDELKKALINESSFLSNVIKEGEPIYERFA